MKALRFAVRDLFVPPPSLDDYPHWDVIAHCDDGKMRHCDDVFTTRDEAEVFVAGWELNPPDDLDQWMVTTISETEGEIAHTS
jgi:hypothetical protein